jgi:hypothetical protein
MVITVPSTLIRASRWPELNTISRGAKRPPQLLNSRLQDTVDIGGLLNPTRNLSNKLLAANACLGRPQLADVHHNDGCLLRQTSKASALILRERLNMIVVSVEISNTLPPHDQRHNDGALRPHNAPKQRFDPPPQHRIRSEVF